jgi:uncharacterized membrane protein YccC
MKFLRYYYYKYFFFYDPTSSWFVHSLKALLATIIASLLAWVEHKLLGIWIVLPTLLFMLMVDVDQSYKKRFFSIITMSAVSFLFVLVLMLTVKWEWLNLTVYLLFAFVGCYLANVHSSLIKTILLTLVFGLLQLRFQSSVQLLPLVALNFLMSLCLVLFFSLVILPNTLATQVKHNIAVSLRNIVRYYIFILRDAAVGNHDVDNRELLQRHAIQQSNNLQAKVILCDKNKKINLIVAKTLQQLLHYAINVEASITRLSTRAYFGGPLQELDACANTTRLVVLDALNGNLAQSDLLQQKYSQLLTAIENQQKAINSNATFIQHDYQHWFNVAKCICRFNETYLQLVDAWQGVNNAN